MTEDATGGRLGALAGVFMPVFLTILGAMVYLREGWLVGNGGLLGALLVIVAAHVITGTTALSVASVATNTHVRPGGAFAIISQSLGLEAGGAIGIPLYVAQTMSAPMYLYAFSEVWGRLYPQHDGRHVAGCAFLVVAALAWGASGLAARLQVVMFGIVLVALGSAACGVLTADPHLPTLIGRFPEASPTECFAIFFPAATGIMVGAGMSGVLRDPRHAIPRGTLAAWGLCFAIYSGAAVWYAVVATPAELLANKTIMVDRALVGQLVLFGAMSSTLTAAFSSLVAASRLLQAMAEHDVVPGSRLFSELRPDGSPRAAAAATIMLATGGLASGSLDAIAPVITAFFILTYLGTNLVVFVEQRLGMISFRPTFAVPGVVPAVGVASCLVGLVLASPRGILIVGGAMVVAIYASLMRRQLKTPWETVGSGLAVSLATWAARRAVDLRRSERSWKPDVLGPVVTLGEAIGLMPIVEPLTRRNGSVKLVGLGASPGLGPGLENVAGRLRSRGIYASATAVHSDEPTRDLPFALDALRSDLFPPNLVLVDASERTTETLRTLRDHCERHRCGLGLWLPHPDGSVGQRRRVAVWVSDREPDWALDLHVANLDLPLLAGFLLTTSWNGGMSLITVLRTPSEEGRRRAGDFLVRLVDRSRFPAETRCHVLEGDFLQRVREVHADVHLFGLPTPLDADRLRAIRDATGAACLFLMDSGQESALA